MQKFEALNEDEKLWISSCVVTAQNLAEQMSNDSHPTDLTPQLLDEIFTTCLELNLSETDQINMMINAVGISFGQLLVDQLGFQWVVVTDEYGCDMGCLALPGKGDVLVCPTHIVAKRWDTRETNFIQPLFSSIKTQLESIRLSRPE